MRALSDRTKREFSLTLFFAASYFLWVTVLALATHAGEGWLSARQMELAYYAQQVFLILTFLGCGIFHRRLPDRFCRSLAIGAAGVFFVGNVVMLTADKGTAFYLAVSAAVLVCLGSLTSTVYFRMSRETAAGVATARCMGVGSSLGILLQYLLQTRWGQSPLLPLFMLAAFGLLAYRQLLCPGEEAAETGKSPIGAVRGVRLLIPCLISALFLFFIDCYNQYIVHLYTQSGFTANNPYLWPRLMVIPFFLLFAAIGDRRQGRLVPLTALCVALAATLNTVLIGSRGAYWVNMCLFYCAVAAAISYYTLVFWRLAPCTGHPVLWASMGRVIDCAIVLVTGAIRLGTLSPAVTLGIDIAGVALIIVMMALSGNFNLAPAAAETADTGQAAPAAPETPPQLTPEETLERMRQRYGLTAREAEVLRELVLTEDKQTFISERLNVTVKTVQAYVTRLYRKTGIATRAGLTDLYHENRSEPE